MIHSRVPILDDAHSIVLSHSGGLNLVSYGNEGCQLRLADLFAQIRAEGATPIVASYDAIYT